MVPKNSTIYLFILYNIYFLKIKIDFFLKINQVLLNIIMFKPLNICSRCSQHMVHFVNFDIKLCYTCAPNAKKHLSDDEINSQPIKITRSNPSEIVDDINELIIPTIKRCTAIDFCKNDPVILKKDDDLYVSNNGLIKEIRSSITFEMVPNYRYNETTKCIEKIDPTIEEEDRRLIVLQRNPNSILEEEFKKI